MMFTVHQFFHYPAICLYILAIIVIFSKGKLLTVDIDPERASSSITPQVLVATKTKCRLFRLPANAGLRV